MKRIVVTCVLILSLLPLCIATEKTSKLWGVNGVLWEPEGRLPDFSFAGYHYGEKPLPDIKTVTSVKKFGAKGDGVTDDTEAFRKAIASVKKGGAILIPKGKYLLSGLIEIKKSGIVLKGEGIDKTVLFFSQSLQKIIPKDSHTTSGKPTSAYSWGGGLIWVKGYSSSRKVTSIIAPARRAEYQLKVKSVQKLKAGDRIRIKETDNPDKSLVSYLYHGDAGKTGKIGKISIDMVADIKKVNRDGTIVLNRPLKFDIRQEWSPIISMFKPPVNEVGIENMTIEFPLTPYGGHFKEQGFNAIAFNGVSDSWIRNIRIVNADSGIFLHAYLCTIDNVIFDSKRKEASKNSTGHHGISLGQDCLVKNFRFNTSFIHDITVGYLSSGNVCSHGYGKILSLDHHRKAPYGNLFTDIDAGSGRDVWRCGGGRALGKHAAAWNTFWNIRAKNPMKYPPASFATPMINIIGIYTNEKSVTDINGKWFEAIPPTELQPQNIYEAQLKKRLHKK